MMISNSKIDYISQVIVTQCNKCKYWHDDVEGWVPFCDLFHGNGLAYPCEQFVPSLPQDSINTELSGENRT